MAAQNGATIQQLKEFLSRHWPRERLTTSLHPAATIMKIMRFEWTSGPLAEGLHCYLNREFFAAHEHWEAEWLKCAEPDKTFLQSLIQITAAFHHLERRNFDGTASLLRAALRRLEKFPAEYQGVAVEEIRQSIRGWIEALNATREKPELPVPRIR